MTDPARIAVLGGTGKLGRALASRLVRYGHDVVLGSRDMERAANVATEMAQATQQHAPRIGSYHRAVSECDIAILCVPFGAHEAVLSDVREAAAGKIVVDATVPLVPPHVSRVTLPEGHSAALEAQRTLGQRVSVVAAFQNVSAVHLARVGHAVDCDVLVCSDSRSSCERIVHLAQGLDLNAYDAGPLANSIAVESLTPLLIWLNRTHKVSGAGIRITGLNRS